MEFQISGRGVTVSDRFREYVNEKSEKIETLADKPQRLEAKVTQEGRSTSAPDSMTVELTVVGRGPVIRSEARAGDKMAAFDLAYAKLLERLRRAHDRRKVHHGRHTPPAVHDKTAGLDPAETGRPLAEQVAPEAGSQDARGDSAPVLIRRKLFPAVPMGLDDAVDAMELVGHDFYVFRDAETGRDSVVYRRAGMTYGVIALDDAVESGSVSEMREYRAG
ncbi:ribosome hibernation-promoting factor, HPF/YfiA family [Falsarthrobacter nasiphocae]|uniref:Ribosome hibernation promoting factor n=1 Tax=Falsarthrobacter nasiphocae TaxID=189863 RepID=A0AAE3YFX3_9MICC|nr:ribosome-associated translation inhibitor RaiA [Falsarthrobacter nasiphocae]MDR6891424.1 ribosomal subunit interface protein [Falsarthrobacter nasiphocae]